mmetsp:Transcript_27007/g.86823  ORF Transcript_27007/g.86823 Transcript_27007/m.86823 type:complete len:210 (+) Transcript_27007:939-1568(+)
MHLRQAAECWLPCSPPWLCLPSTTTTLASMSSRTTWRQEKSRTLLPTTRISPALPARTLWRRSLLMQSGRLRGRRKRLMRVVLDQWGSLLCSSMDTRCNRRPLRQQIAPSPLLRLQWPRSVMAGQRFAGHVATLRAVCGVFQTCLALLQTTSWLGSNTTRRCCRRLCRTRQLARSRATVPVLASSFVLSSMSRRPMLISVRPRSLCDTV